MNIVIIISTLFHANFFQEFWYGDAIIYCIIAKSNYQREAGSTVEVIEGGISHPYIRLRFRTKAGGPCDYNVRVYGKNITHLI